MLCHKINKFYKTFGEVLGYQPPRIRVRDLTSDLMMSVGFDIAEAIEAQSDCFYEESYALVCWLNKLYEEVVL